jgi:preprotein translocase subunit SecE
LALFLFEIPHLTQTGQCGMIFEFAPLGRFKLHKNMAIIRYIKETSAELKHVNWPSRKQTLIYTSLIIVISLFVAAYLGLFDWLFTNLVKLFV